MSKNLYISQTGAGSFNGTNALNAYSIGWFNSGVNWGASVSQISSGDTVHACGIITGQLSFQQGGLSGQPTTLLFEPGCNLSAPAWSVGGAITTNSKSNITIDGGAVGLIGSVNGNPTFSNGIIQCTANGTAGIYPNQIASIGILITNSSNIIVQNLVVSNIYNRVGYTDQFGSVNRIYGINSSFSTNVKVTNCIIHDTEVGFGTTYSIGAASTEYSFCTAYNVNWGGNAADNNNTSTLSGLYVHDNYFYNFTNWDDNLNNSFHHNGFFGWSVQLGGSAFLSTVRFYNNVIGPGFYTGNGTTNHATSALFAEGNVIDFQAYNNVLIGGTNDYPSSAYLTLSPTNQTTSIFQVYNNTIIGGSATGGIAINFSADNGTGVTGNLTGIFHNNIIQNVNSAISSFDNNPANVNMSIISNNNSFYGLLPSQQFCISATSSSHFLTFAQWQTSGYDINSFTGNPNLASNYKLPPNSLAIGSGVNLASKFNNDILGNLRSPTANWDLGAYAFLPIFSPTSHSTTLADLTTTSRRR